MLYCVSDHVLLDTSSPALFLGSTLLAGLDVHDYGTFVKPPTTEVVGF